MRKILLIVTALFYCVSILNGQGQPQTKYYDPAGDIWKWDTIITYNTLQESQRIIQVFNTDGSIALKTIQVMPNYAWLNYSKSSYTYDAANLITTEVNQLWDGGAWANDTRNTLTETTQSGAFIETKVTESWQSGNWVNTWRNTHTINTDISFTDLTEQYVHNAWANYFSITSWTDLINLQYGQDGQYWDGSRWVDSWRDTYTTNLYLEVQSVLHEAWEGGVLNKKSLYLHTNNPDGYPTQILRQEWHTILWADSARTTYVYDATDNAVSGAYEAMKSGAWQPAMGDMKIYYSGSTFDYFKRDAYENIRRFSASYAAFPDGIVDLQNPAYSISVYPNPANDYITIALKNLFIDGLRMRIYDINGRIVEAQTLHANKTVIDVSQLAEGVYMVRLESSGNAHIARFVKTGK